MEHSILRNKLELEKAVLSSVSIASTLRCLDLVPSGGNYTTINHAIKKFGIDTSHFTGQGHLSGKTHNFNTRPLDEILVKGKLENTYRLRNRLLRDKIKRHQCENCKLETWLDKPIPLELHHVDGDRTNNLLENIQLLCPNCHALTDNYRAKKTRKIILCSCGKEMYKGSRKCKECRKINYVRKGYSTPKYCICGKLISIRAKNCKSCTRKGKREKIQWPSIDELKNMVRNSSYLAISRTLGVSDSAIRKRIKNHS
jgi:hypothetical protein